MKKSKIILTGFIAMVMVCMTCFPVFGTVMNAVIYLGANQTWTSSYSDSRSGRYSYAYATCDSVYPINGSDSFEKIQVRVLNSGGTVISSSSYVVLSEKNAPAWEKVQLKDGYLNLTTVYFQFRGNSSSSANAVVDYSGN